MKLKQIFILTAIALLTIASCKKGPDPDPIPGVGTRAELTKDSIFLYAKQIYLWKDGLPTYEAFNPRKYTSKNTDFLNYERELIDLAKIVKNPSTGLGFEYFTTLNAAGNPVEVDDSKYSYISDIADKNPTAFIPTKTSAVDLEGNGNDFGIKLGAYAQNETSATDEYALFVTAVYQNSPADIKGVIRSDRIYKINNRVIGNSYSADRDFINTSFNTSATQVILEGVKYINGVAGTAYTVTLNKAVYKSDPVYASKVFTAGPKNVGYLAYARFSTLANSKPSFDAAFAKFAAANVTELIIDLRYNGGGYVKTAQYLIDQIAPSSLFDKVMYTETYNTLLQSGGATILKYQPYTINDKIQYLNGRMLNLYDDVDYSVKGNTEKFDKNGPLTGVTKVVFIVSGNTASASELVINSLKPHITVKLVGTQTYGKPVGFFPIRIENKYDVFYSLFQTKNSLGQGDYFGGFTPDVNDDFDDPRYNFGDPKERYTSLALNNFGVAGPITTALAKTMSIKGKNIAVESLKPMKPIVDGNEFIGMIETKHKLKN